MSQTKAKAPPSPTLDIFDAVGLYRSATKIEYKKENNLPTIRVYLRDSRLLTYQLSIEGVHVRLSVTGSVLNGDDFSKPIRLAYLMLDRTEELDRSDFWLRLSEYAHGWETKDYDASIRSFMNRPLPTKP